MTAIAAPPDRQTVPAAEATEAATGRTPMEVLQAVCAVAGPLLLAGASLAWLAGDGAAEARGILQFWAFPALAVAGIAAASRLDDAAPVARALLTALMAIGAVAGGSFAQEILMVEHFGTERLLRQDTPSALVALGLPGLLYPMGLVLTGALSLAHRTLPRWQAALLLAGGALFPLSRVPELPALALVADVAIAGGLMPLALRRRGR